MYNNLPEQGRHRPKSQNEFLPMRQMGVHRNPQSRVSDNKSAAMSMSGYSSRDSISSISNTHHKYQEASDQGSGVTERELIKNIRKRTGR